MKKYLLLVSFVITITALYSLPILTNVKVMEFPEEIKVSYKILQFDEQIRIDVNIFNTNKIGKAIILTPGSGLVNLKRAIMKFTNIIGEDIILVTKKNRDAYTTGRGKIFISTYSTFRLSETYYNTNPHAGFYTTMRNWLNKYPGAFVLDEGHYIGNPTSQQTKAVQSVSDLFEYRMASTGTPADKPDKYYSLLKFIHPYFVRYLGFTDWKKVVANIGTSFSAYAISSFREEDLRYFLESSANNYTNLKDTDVLELPEHYFKPTYIQMEDLHKDIYEAFNTYQLGLLKDMGGGRLTPLQVFNKFPYMLLSVDDPSILATNTERTFTTDTTDTQKIEKLLKRFKFEKHHAKLEVLKEIIKTHVDEKGEQIVVWTGHPMTANSLAEVFKDYKPLVMHGKTKVDKGLSRDEMKDKVVQEFINDKARKILFASFYVLDTAVDIVNASTQVYMDLPYMFTHFDQSYKRLHRYGQEKTVDTYILIFENTLDEIRYAIVQQKKAFDTDALNNTLPLEDWKKIFAGTIPQSLEQEKLNLMF